MYVVIAGGGLVGGTLAVKLAENRHDVVVIERDKEVCENIAARTGALVINGLATHIEILDDAGMDKADVAVGTRPYDAGNLSFALLARDFKVPRIIARMRSPRYAAAYRLAGVTRALDIGSLFVNQFTLEIEQPDLRQVATFGGGKGSIVVAVVPDAAAVHGKSVMEIARHRDFPNECLITGIYREKTRTFIIPRGGIEVQSGDQLFLAADTGNVRKAAEFLQRTA